MSHPPQKNLRKQNSQKKVADSQEVTPLFAATTSCHEEIVQYLVIQSQNCKFKKEPDLETLAPHVSQKNSSSSLIISNWMVHLSYFMVTRSPFLSFFSLLMVFDVWLFFVSPKLLFFSWKSLFFNYRWVFNCLFALFERE